MKEEICEVKSIHLDVVEKVKPMLLKDEEMEKLASFYKVFADETRIKIMYALSRHSLCVCDIAVLLHMTQSAISHQLSLLRVSDLVTTNKVGKVVYYSLKDDHIAKIVDMGLEHVREIR